MQITHILICYVNHESSFTIYLVPPANLSAFFTHPLRWNSHMDGQS
jgi:hypothetical protein